jgi:hypothetical protein
VSCNGVLQKPLKVGEFKEVLGRLKLLTGEELEA